MRHIHLTNHGSRLDAFDSSDIAPDDVLDALEALARYVSRVGGYMQPEDQEILTRAKAVLREQGRTV